MCSAYNLSLNITKPQGCFFSPIPLHHISHHYNNGMNLRLGLISGRHVIQCILSHEAFWNSMLHVLFAKIVVMSAIYY